MCIQYQGNVNTVQNTFPLIVKTLLIIRFLDQNILAEGSISTICGGQQDSNAILGF